MIDGLWLFRIFDNLIKNGFQSEWQIPLQELLSNDLTYPLILYEKDLC